MNLTGVVDLTWEDLVAVLIIILVVGFIAIVWLTRDPRSHRVRFGVFLERDDHEQHPDHEENENA